MAQAQESFDYVVAGGGIAGCVLAARLSADPNLRVLLLESGRSDRNPFIHLPAGFSRLDARTYQWGHESVPQIHCNNRRLPLAQGRVLGGGGSINAQVYTRGVAQDYDSWETDHGCRGWSAAEVHEYFVKAESNNRLVGPMHGVQGPIGVSDPVNPSPLSLAFVLAGQEFGLPFNADFNGPDQHGVGLYQTTTRRARRSSTAVAYLHPARRRPNLVIRTRATVRRVVIDSNRATGVEVGDRDGVRVYGVRREVILAAGAYGSPKILMLSGIGKPDHLRDVGIPVVHPLPGVGDNLQDHADIDLVYELKERTGLDRYANPALAAVAAAQYLLFRRGPLTSTVIEAGAFTFADPQEPTPDLQYHFIPAATVDAAFAGLRRGYGCTINSYVLRPRSRGTIRLAGADPASRPLIDPNFLADEYDLELAIESVRQGRAMMSEPAMAEHVAAERLPAGNRLASKDDYVRFVRENLRTACHPVGTCAMGDGDQSVVSPSLVVHGLENVRVADSSIMPSVVSANTQAPTAMIAEKAADLILQDSRR